MIPTDNAVVEPSSAPAHSTSLERQRRRPMWGCVKAILILSAIFLLVLALGVWSGWRYLGSSNFADLIVKRIEANLESHLGRDVSIRKVTFIRARPTKLIIDDLRIANVPGAAHPYFATVRQIEITGGVDSFWNRQIRLGLIEVRDPRVNFEVFPQGHPLQHNWPTWKRSPPRKYEITRMDISKLLIVDGAFQFLDHRHDIEGLVTRLAADVDPAFRQGIYRGVGLSPSVRLQIKDYEPMDLNLRGGFYYRPGSLSLESVALRGRGIETFVRGRVDPLSQAVYDLHVTGKTEMARLREIFRLERQLQGEISLDGTLKGEKGDFLLNADFVLPELVADTYELSDVRGVMRVSEENTTVQVRSASYGGGTLNAQYELATYGEPYPMSMELRYDRVSIEKLFADWNLENTGLRGGATGTLNYAWNKDDLMSGRGQGTATLNRGAVAFGSARYPVPVGGRTRFALNRGVVTFALSTLQTGSSTAAFRGTLRIEDLRANFDVRVDSRDFVELDRIGYNFAHAAGKRDYELLGLGGSGRITGTVRGPLGEPDVDAHIVGSATRYNDVLLGGSDIDLRYDGPRGVLTFERAVFRDGEATLQLAGTVAFPDRGPSPRFDLQIEAAGYDVQRALGVVGLEFAISGAGTGALRVEGTPDAGRVTFADLRIARDQARLRLNGLLAWAPGEGNVTFDLDIGAESYPVGDLLAFLDMKNVPISGALTGTLHLEGPKQTLEGAGSVTVRNGTVFGEPVELATADLLFTRGMLRATHLEVRSPAGVLLGEADVNLANERFSYVIRSSDLDVSRLQSFAALRRFFGGRLRLTSSGAGTFDQPEVVVEATLIDGALGGTTLPADAPPPSIYFATREGRLVIRGSGLNAFSITGDGTIAPDGTVDGAVRIEVTDVARLLSVFSPATDFPASGNLVVHLDLGGKLTPIEALKIDGTVPTLNLRISEHVVTASEPIRFVVDQGRLELLSYRVVTDGSSFSAEGFVSLVGERQINLRLQGLLEAAFVQLFVPDMRAQGHINVAADITGTLAVPRIEGTAELQNAELKIDGFPQLIDDITGTVVFRGDRLELDSLRATLGGGSLSAGGFMTLDGIKPQTVRINVQGTDVSIRYFEGLTIDGDVSLLLSGEVERMVLQGEVRVDQAVYYKDIDLSTELLTLILERRGLLPEVAASWQDRIALRVSVRAPDTIAVKNNIADVTGSAELEVAGTLANPIILGTVAIDEGGRVRIQDQDYRVVRGTINFQNPFQTDPFFDITAEGRQGEYQLTINLTGTLDRITPTITSDPPASDLTLLSLIAPNLRNQGNGPVDLESLQTFGTSILVQSLGGLLGTRILPFADAVRLEGLMGESERGPSVSFEKRINEDLRVIVTYYTEDAQNRHEEVVEWQVTPDWILEFKRDPALGDAVLVNAVNARFRRRYEGRW
jgi:autotransporter translocation and assembly factor TamB